MPPRWRSSGAATGGSGPVLVELARLAPAPAAGKWTDLALRTASALVLAPAALGCIWLGGAAWWALLAVAAAALGLEWITLCRAGGVGAGLRAAGLLYLAVVLGCLMWLRADPAAGRRDLLLLLAIVWAADIGAYVAGRAIGGPRLAPRISPGKTWSGTAGGLLAAGLVGLVVARGWDGRAWAGAALGLLLGVASQLGDLSESWVKRRCGVKDSGRLIPGHGGVLDRLDGVLLAAPVLAAVAVCVGRGVRLWN